MPPERAEHRKYLTRIDQALAESTPPTQIELIKKELRRQFTTESMDWVFQLADVVGRNDLGLHVLRRCAANLAWDTRDIGQRLPNDEDWRRVAETANPAATARTLAYVHGNRLRYDTRFEQLAIVTHEWLASHPDDSLIHSLAAFAALGQRSDRALPLLARASALPDYDFSCRAVCLQGLWFGSHLPDQAGRILALSDEMIGRGEDDPNLYYWRAFALRREGRFDEALTSVDRAISLLPVGMNAVHQDYFRERELIKTTTVLNQQVVTMTDKLLGELREQFQQHQTMMRQEVERQTSTARRLVTDSLLGIVEVLALFVTLAGFLIGSGALVLRADGFSENLSAIGLLAAGAIGFFVLLRLVVRLDRGHPHERLTSRWLARALRRGGSGAEPAGSPVNERQGDP